MLAYLAAFALSSQAPTLPAADCRKDQAGWIYVRLSGTPTEIGYGEGTLLASEIDDSQRALRVSLLDSGKDWNFYRETAKSMFWPKIPAEYRQEMQGQADALKAKGLSYDVWDVLAYNAYIELSQYYVPWLRKQPSHKESCSAFIATGSQTKDGKIVMGHNLWWDYLMGERFNVILDITPQKGNRIMLDCLPGFIHSGSDFAINSAGMVLCETTIAGFEGFDPNGQPEFIRMRKSIQYSSSLDEFCHLMEDGNNGGYANTWLVGDTKTNEIGKLELGLKNVSFVHKLDGSYVGSNFPENPKLIAQELPGGWDPNPLTNGCEQRKVRWNHLLEKNMGEVDDAMARSFLEDTVDENTGHDGMDGGTLCGDWGGAPGGAVNAKVVTASMVAHMQFWARMGVPNGIKLPVDRFVGSSANLKSILHDIEPHPWTQMPPSTASSGSG